jgi:hypothetical protein
MAHLPQTGGEVGSILTSMAEPRTMLSTSETADYFREKAAQCRRLADAILDDKDPTRIALLALAVEFETKAVALAAEEVAEKQVEQAQPDKKE